MKPRAESGRRPALLPPTGAALPREPVVNTMWRARFKRASASPVASVDAVQTQVSIWSRRALFSVFVYAWERTWRLWYADT
jgi:hypothetical protein